MTSLGSAGPRWEPRQLRPRVPGLGHRHIELTGEETWHEAEPRHTDGRVTQQMSRQPKVKPADKYPGVAEEDFAGPHRSFPIRDVADLPDVARLAHHAANPGEILSNAKRIARRKFGDVELPESIASAKGRGVPPGVLAAGSRGMRLPAYEPAEPVDWASAYKGGTYQPAPVHNGSYDSPGNHPRPRDPGRLAEDHQLTASTPGGDRSGRVGMHSWNQVTAPTGGADLATVEGDGPIAGSIRDHQGRVVLVEMDQARASWPGLGSQLGRNAPQGARGTDRPPFGTAESGYGQLRGETPRRAGGEAYSSVPKFRHLTQRAPGETC